jgi:RNA polymerase sigma factor (sigma-70 family)
MARELAAVSTEDLLQLASTSESEVLGQVVAELIMRYKTIVYNQALRVSGRNHALADEVFQETFVRLFGWLRTRPDRQTLHTFPKLLSVFSKRAAIDLMRKEIRETPSASTDEALSLAIEEEPSWETKAYVLELLETLDERTREVIKLTYFDGLSAVEIAKKIALTPGHVRILRFRALEALRARKEADEIADFFESL